MKKFYLILWLAVLFMAINPVYGSAANDGKLDISDTLTKNSAHVYPYIQHMVYTVYCRVDRIVDVELQVGEKFLYIGGADTTRWVIDPVLLGSGVNEQWHINVKPNVDDKSLSTNFLIGTNLHVYHIEAFVSPQNFTPIICWTYPQEERLAAIRAQQEQKEKESDNILLDVSLADVNFNYQIYGKSLSGKPSYSWTPQIVFDDGTKTYMKMPKEMGSTETPVLFVKDDGQLTLVNYRVQHSYFIVDRVFNEAEMRNGKTEIVRIVRKK
ncbi:MAG: TrbG/VirB9 family P-type conjugative transfer protein [Bacteroidota bacterium]